MKLKNKMILGLVMGSMIIPTIVSNSYAAPMARSTPRVSVSRPSISRPVTRPSTIKPGSSTMKPSSGSKIPRVSKPSSTSSKPKVSINKPKTSTSIPKPKAPKNYTRPSYIDNYSTSRMNYNSGLSFWQMYGLTHMMNNNPSEREIAEELSKKGYSESEINSILKKADKENRKKNNKPYSMFPIVMGSIVMVVLLVGGIMFFRSRF